MSDKEIIKALIPFAHHAYNCESLEPMWHKGPCDCGFATLVVKLRALGVDIKDGSIPYDQPQPPLKDATQEIDDAPRVWPCPGEHNREVVNGVCLACGRP